MAATLNDLVTELRARNQIALAALFQAPGPLVAAGDNLGNPGDNAAGLVDQLVDRLSGDVVDNLIGRGIVRTVLFPNGLPPGLPNLDAVFPDALSVRDILSHARNAKVGGVERGTQLSTLLGNDNLWNQCRAHIVLNQPYNLGALQTALASARDINAVKRVLAEKLLGVPAGDPIPAGPIQNAIDAAIPDINTANRLRGEARYAQRGTIGDIANAPALRGVLDHGNCKAELTASLADFGHQIVVADIQAALAGAVDTNAIKRVLAERLFGVAAAVAVIPGPIQNAIDAAVPDLAAANRLRGEARYFQRGTIANIADATALRGVLDHRNCRVELINYLEDLGHQIVVADTQIALAGAADTNAIKRVLAERLFGVAAAAAVIPGPIQNAIDAAVPADPAANQLRGEARYAQRVALYPALAGVPVLAALINANANKAAIEAFLAGNILDVAAIQVAIAGAADLNIVKNELNRLTGIVVADDDIARNLRIEARNTLWLQPKLNALPARHPFRVAVVNAAADPNNHYREQLQGQLGQYAQTQNDWNRLFDQLSEQDRTQVELGQVCTALGIPVAAQAAIVPSIYAENQKARIAAALGARGLNRAQGIFLGINANDNAYSRLSPVDLQRIVTDDINNIDTDSVRFNDVFATLGLTAAEAANVSRNVASQRNISGTLKEIQSPEWRKLIQELNLEPNRLGDRTSGFIQWLNQLDPRGHDIQWLRGELNRQLRGIGDHLVNDAGDVQAIAARAWPGKTSVEILTLLRNEKDRLESYEGLTNLPLKLWLTEKEGAPRIVNDAAGAAARTADQKRAALNALDAAANPTYQNFTTVFQEALTNPGVAAVATPSVEQYNAMRVYGSCATGNRFDEESRAVNSKIDGIAGDLKSVRKTLAVSFNDPVVRNLMISADYADPTRLLSEDRDVLTDEVYRLGLMKAGLLTQRAYLLSISERIKGLKDQLPKDDQIPDAAQLEEVQALRRKLSGSGAAGAEDEVVGQNVLESLMFEVEERLAQVSKLVTEGNNRLAVLNQKTQALTAAIAADPALRGAKITTTLSDTKPILVGNVPERNADYRVATTLDDALTLLKSNTPTPGAPAVVNLGGAVAAVGRDTNLSAVDKIIPVPENTAWLVAGVRNPQTEQLEGVYAVSQPRPGGDQNVYVKALPLTIFSRLRSVFSACNLNCLTERTADQIAKELILKANADQDAHRGDPEYKTVIRLNRFAGDDAKLIYKHLGGPYCKYRVIGEPNMGLKERTELERAALEFRDRSSDTPDAKAEKLNTSASILTTPPTPTVGGG